MAPRRFIATVPTISDQSQPILESVTGTVIAICILVLASLICGSCCKKKTKKDDEKAKEEAEKAALIEKAGKIDVSPRIDTPMPPREPITVSRVSTSSFAFALNVYRWSGSIHARRTIFAFPSALQVAFGPYFEASKRLTRTQMRTVLFPLMPEKDVDETLNTLAAAISPAALDGQERGWRLATRLYAMKKRMDAYCPEYRQSFDSLNQRGGKTMEMVPFDEKDMKNVSPVVDDLNAWTKRSIGFMTRPLFENAEKKMKTFFLNKVDPRLILVNVCGFRCPMEYPFHAANISMVGHPFLSYDGRKLIPGWPMMHSSEEDETNCYYCYREDDEFQFLRLPLRRGSKSEAELALYLMLPKERGALRMLERKFSPESFTGRIKDCVQPERVRIVLPKMELESRFKNFADAMKSFGAKSLLDPRSAELASMYAAEPLERIAPGLKVEDPAKECKNCPDTVLNAAKAKARMKRPQSKLKPPKGKTAMLHATENPCLTDAIHAGSFQILDDEAEKIFELKEASKTVIPTVSSTGSSIGKSITATPKSIRSGGSITASPPTPPSPPSKTVDTVPSSPESKTVEVDNPAKSSPDADSKSAKGSPKSSKGTSRPSIFSRLSRKSGKNKSDKEKSESKPSGSGKASDKKEGSSIDASGRSGKASDKASTKSPSQKSGIASEKKASQKGTSGRVDTEAPCPVCTRMESRGVHLQMKRFVADHPFIWIVVIEKPTLLPLVMGRFCGEKS